MKKSNGYLAEPGVTMTVDGQDFHLGYSRIKSYLDCPKMYEYTYVKGLRDKPNAAMKRGSAYHDTLELMLLYKMNEEKHCSLKSARKAALANTEKHECTDGDREKVLKAVDFYHENLYEQHRPILVEEMFSIVRGGVKLTGRIDLIHQEDAELAKVVDHKFSYAHWNEVRAMEGIQPIIYQWAYEDLYAKDFGLQYGGFQYNILRQFPFSQYQIIDIPPVDKDKSDWLEEQVHQIAKAIQAGIFPPNPKEKQCNWCSHKKLCKPAFYKPNLELVGDGLSSMDDLE